MFGDIVIGFFSWFERWYYFRSLPYSGKAGRPQAPVVQSCGRHGQEVESTMENVTCYTVFAWALFLFIPFMASLISTSVNSLSSSFFIGSVISVLISL